MAQFPIVIARHGRRILTRRPRPEPRSRWRAPAAHRSGRAPWAARPWPGSPTLGGTERPADRLSFVEFPARLNMPSWARRFTVAVLNAWQVAPEAIATSELLVTELVTNAIQASRAGAGCDAPCGQGCADLVSLALCHRDGQVVIEVTDTDPNPPVLAQPGRAAESGRGLMIVQALSEAWGHHLRPGGKTVFCVIGTALR